MDPIDTASNAWVESRTLESNGISADLADRHSSSGVGLAGPNGRGGGRVQSVRRRVSAARPPIGMSSQQEISR
jgi:hypothetical protein